MTVQSSSSPAADTGVPATGRFDGGAADWDAFVRAQHGWTHFHRAGWRGVIERTFGHEYIPLAARDTHGSLAAVLPLVRVRSRVFGHFLVSMPFLNYGGPLGAPEAVRRLVDDAAALARADGVRLLELRSRTPLPTALPVTHRKITVLLDLPPEADALWQRLGSKLRAQIRRPQKEGAVTRFGADQLGAFHRVYARNMRDLGTPAQPRRFFEEIARSFPDDVVFGCVYLDGAPAAAGCGFRWADEFEMTWASSLRSVQRRAPNMQLYWSFMEHAIAGGVRTFNFGRCSPGSGTHRFKLQWGGREEALWWYQQAAGEVRSTPNPETNGAYALAARLWRHLPLAAANRLGPGIVRYIP